jgi:hypothetical protein
MANCDEFIFYDDLVREKAKKQSRKKKASTTEAGTVAKTTTPEPDRRQEALDLVLETVEALFSERTSEEKIWGSMVKQALKRRKPGFSESYYGFRSFGKLLEDAEARGLLTLEPDEKSGGVIIRSFNQDY